MKTAASHRYLYLGPYRTRTKVVTAEEASSLTGMSARYFRKAAAEGKAPPAVARDLESGANLYVEAEVLAWGYARPGRGNRTPRT